jgi:cysteine-rich repeat protein
MSHGRTRKNARLTFLRVLSGSGLVLLCSCLVWDPLQHGRCGDGFVGPEEGCDDHNTLSGDGCSARCELESPEPDASDPEPDGSTPEHDAAPPAPRCGDGQLDAEEVCDDGNQSNGDGCLNGCSRATCGDGFTRVGVEECDVAGDAPCTPACLDCGAEPEGFFRVVNRHCFTRHTEPRTQAEARSACQDEGGDLWSVNTEDEGNSAVTRLALSGAQWLGMVVEAGTPRWLSGESLDFQNFAADQPGMAKCVALTADGSANAWRSSACAMQLPFVCERAAPFVDIASNHAYRLHTAEVTVDEARVSCATEGGALVSLETDAERAFLTAKLNVRVWVDASELDDGTFQWATGVAVDAALFRPGEPDDAADLHDCLLLEPKKRLVDESCSQAAAYVCELP